MNKVDDAAPKSITEEKIENLKAQVRDMHYDS